MLWLVLAAAVPASAADTYTVRSTDSTVYAVLHLNETQIAKTLGSLDHVVKLALVDGSVTVDGDTVSAAQISGTVASLKSGDAALRKLAGLTGAVADDEGKRLLDCVFNQLQPEVDNTVTFKATSATGSLGDLKVTGDLTLHGVSHTLTVPLKLVATGEGLHATGKVDIHVPDYGFRIPESGWSVKDEATLVLDLSLAK